jgi:hypothetical protein
MGHSLIFSQSSLNGFLTKRGYKKEAARKYPRSLKMLEKSKVCGV